MSDLIVVAFDDIHKADEVLLELNKLQKEYLVDLEDAAVVVKDEQGKVKLKQAVNLTAVGAAEGGMWGMLIGLLFLAPVAGLAIGAGAGALAGKASDIGIDDKFMEEIGDKLNNESSALFVLVKKSTPEKVLPELSKFEGTVLQTSLSHDAEEQLREAFSKSTTPHIEEVNISEDSDSEEKSDESDED